MMATGFGAAIVIVGAMFKIQHWPGASVMLIGGLSVEAFLFVMGAFEEPHMDIDWTLAYPELAGGHGHGEENHEEEVPELLEEADPISQKLDKMLMDANIGPELLDSLGKGLKNLGDTAGNMNNLGNASAASNEFVEKIKGASENVGKLSDSYSRASVALTDLTDLKGTGASYAEELTKMTRNLSELNDVYSKQVSSTNESMKLSTEVSDNINQLLLSLSSSVEDTKKYKEEISVLGQNLSKLNTIYGNMLSAMTVRQ
ncbi:MAG: gliding motility protein GldL [Bacteroidetes bacterium]|nr:gliding motility protein GldL [Bacteroidota bacterium]